jgi:hypothetical protein
MYLALDLAIVMFAAPGFAGLLWACGERAGEAELTSPTVTNSYDTRREAQR